MLQIRAYLPQKGEVNLLASPPLDEAAKLLSGTGTDAAGAKSLAMGAAIEVPWAGRISGGATPDGKNLITMWRGERLILPADVEETATGSGERGGCGRVTAEAAFRFGQHKCDAGWRRGAGDVSSGRF